MSLSLSAPRGLGASGYNQWPTVAAAHLRGQKHMVGCKDGTILGLSFSPLEQSISMDDLVNSYGIPVGPCCSRHLRPPPSYVVMCPPATV